MSIANPEAPIRVLVVDDSALNRQTIAGLIESQPGLRVVGRAGDGNEGLRLAFETQPDIITLDLEMPRMDGFTFLRILMSRRATPVIVISSQGSRENVFKALELGALDFVVKPVAGTAELRSIRDDLVAKLRLATQLRAVSLEERARQSRPLSAGIPSTGTTGQFPIPEPAHPPAKAGPAPDRLVLIGASTGGPPAVLQILSQIDPATSAGIAITQHMPPKFTRAFAERLHRLSKFHVREAADGDALAANCALVAPGGGSMLLGRDGNSLRVRLDPGNPEECFVPSIDRMFETAADALGPAVLGIILTGMAGDVARGVRAVKARGGRIIAEDPETAVVPGMPGEAIATGLVDEVLPLARIPDAIARFVAG